MKKIKTFPEQKQKLPGNEHQMNPEPEIIRENYTGSGKLLGKTAFITGGDSGIGRSAAVHFAREGANVAIVYLKEDKDAKETKELIERKKVGWVGKSKGLLQVLWERGFIDETSIEKYKLTGKNDDFGIVDNSTSLRHMMTMCSDFLHEQGMMEFIGRKVGVEVILTPKCRPELAGEGVEYIWAFWFWSTDEKTMLSVFGKS